MIQLDEWIEYYVARVNEVTCQVLADDLQAQILDDSSRSRSPSLRQSSKRVSWPDELSDATCSPGQFLFTRTLEEIRVIENCRDEESWHAQAKTALRIFNCADINQDGALSLMELNAYILANPEELADVTEPGASQWSVLMQLFRGSEDGSLSGIIQREDWLEYYIARVTELNCKNEADTRVLELSNAAEQSAAGDDPQTANLGQQGVHPTADVGVDELFDKLDTNGDGLVMVCWTETSSRRERVPVWELLSCKLPS